MQHIRQQHRNSRDAAIDETTRQQKTLQPKRRGKNSRDDQTKAKKSPAESLHELFENSEAIGTSQGVVQTFAEPFREMNRLFSLPHFNQIPTGSVLKSGTGVPPVVHAQDARATSKLHQYPRSH